MYNIISLQLSLFGSFVNIKPNTDLIIKLLNALKDQGFLPGSADIANIDAMTGKIAVDSRMQLISPDKTWTIVILPERIDFNYNEQIGTQGYSEISSLLTIGQDLVEKVFSVFPDTRGNRIAINCRLELNGISEDQLMQTYSRFVKPLSVFDNNKLNEWSVRFNSRSNFRISDSEEEECNRIVELTNNEVLNPFGSKNELKNNFTILVDTNTSATNLDMRFKYENLVFFSSEVVSFIKEVVMEIEGEE